MTLKHNLLRIEGTAKPFKDLVAEAVEKHPKSWNQVQMKIENIKYVKLSEVQKLIEELENLKQKHVRAFTAFGHLADELLAKQIDEVIGQ